VLCGVTRFERRHLLERFSEPSCGLEHGIELVLQVAAADPG
jgi:hypothetical protein